MKASKDFAQQIVDWQRAQGRHHLPWQNTRDPYLVWLSEIMLQQTQVTTVVDYFERFTTRLPTVQHLAQASEEEVMSLWAGLGYYARARHLHACAKSVVNEWQGNFPTDSESLQSLPGIGPSTAAAIAAFCHNERVSILDGNVKRVMARYFGIDGDVNQGATVKRLWTLARDCLPKAAQVESEPGVMTPYTQGLMDLGATLCTRRSPDCPRCPLNERCIANRDGLTETLPVKRRKVERPRREIHLLWITHAQRVWLERRPDKGIWGRLWCLPLFDDLTDLQSMIYEKLGENAELVRMASVGHDLTHFRLTLTPWRITLPEGYASPLIDQTVGAWVEEKSLAQKGLPKPIRELLIGTNG